MQDDKPIPPMPKDPVKEYELLMQRKEQIDKELQKTKEQLFNNLREEILEKVNNSPFEFDELFPQFSQTHSKPAMKSVKSRSDLPPTHRDPENPDHTWTGKGRKPKWLVSYIEDGRETDEFLIQ